MEIRSLEETNAVVITPAENLALERVSAIDDALQRALQGDAECVILDLVNVDHCDSNGIGALVKAHHQADALRKRFFIIGMGPNVRRVFRLSNLYKVFDIFSSLDDVLFTLEEHQVLLWDDRNTVIDFYRDLLTVNGFGLQIAGDGQEASRILEESPISVVVLDVGEREEPKYEFIRSLRQGSHASIPVVVVSSYLEEEPSYRSIGVNLFVSKPFRVERLIRDLRELSRERP